MKITNASRFGPQMDKQEAAELEAARAKMLARHKLIEAMIRNNELQLKNESARGGCQIEREAAVRDNLVDEIEQLTRQLRELHSEHRRLITEREWLNNSLLEYENEDAGSSSKNGGNA